MSQVEYLDLEDLLAMVRALEAGPVRDVGLLDSAAARPPSSALGQEAYPTLALKAAALLALPRPESCSGRREQASGLVGDGGLSRPQGACDASVA
jgi:hypothetical protein